MKFIRQLSLLALALVSSLISRAGELRLDLEHAGSNATVQLSGDAGTEYLIESAHGSADQWSPVTSFFLTDPSRLWKDPSATVGNRFFRARSKTTDDIQYAKNFRLIDQNGVSREMFYYYTLETWKAFVLVFTEGNYSGFASKIAALKSNPTYANKVLFWAIDTDVNTTRSNILKQATAAGISWPVFHDPMQLVTHDYGAHFNGEALVISRDLQVVYRGVIDDGSSNYVAAALSSLVADAPIATTRLEPSQTAFTPRVSSAADYSTEIAPLLQAKCITCHSPDNIGSYALTNYASVVSYASKMKDEIMAARMPPWHADPQYGKFQNDLSLSATQKAKLIDWIDAGAPRGSGPDILTNVPPAPPKWPAELGEPDQIVTIPVQSIPAYGTNAYRYIYANATNTEGKWLRAAVVRPGNNKVVHHYIIWEGHSASAMLSGVALYAPGHNDQPFPEGTGIYLPPNCDLTFNLHYTSDGSNETDKPELGLWYASTPPAKELKTAAMVNGFFTIGFGSIPAGNPDYEMTATAYVINNQVTPSALTFANPVRIYSFSPHMHFRGSRMRFEVTLPGSTTKQIVCSVPNYRFDWQSIYTLETPLDLPAGARLDMVGAFDNSAQNLNNPDPTIAMPWGEQSWQEMFIGYITFSDR